MFVGHSRPLMGFRAEHSIVSALVVVFLLSFLSLISFVCKSSLPRYPENDATRLLQFLPFIIFMCSWAHVSHSRSLSLLFANIDLYPTVVLNESISTRSLRISVYSPFFVHLISGRLYFSCSRILMAHDTCRSSVQQTLLCCPINEFGVRHT